MNQQQQHNRYHQEQPITNSVKTQKLVRRRRQQNVEDLEGNSSSNEEFQQKMGHKTNKQRNQSIDSLQYQQQHQYNSDSSMTISDTTTPAIAIPKTRALNSHRTVGTRTTRRLSEESSLHEYQQQHRNNKAVKRSGHNSKMWRNELHVNPSSRRAQPQRRYSSDFISNDDDGEDTDERRSSRGGVVARNHRRRIIISNLVDVGIRVVCVIAFANLEIMQAFKRKMHMEEIWLYKNPRLPDIVSPNSLIIAVLLVPFCATIVHYLLTQNRRDFLASNWAWTMSVCLNGMITSTLKITIGRPRPDFFYRCFPDGVMILNNISDTTNLGDYELFNCTGNARDINEGRKSFPSGHSSFAFASFGFVGLYLASKLHALSPAGRGQTWRLCLSLAPFFIAALVAISRYCDYHHHWQDVLGGSIIGTIVTYFIYRQYYPSLCAPNCEYAYTRHIRHKHQENRTNNYNRSYASLPPYDDAYANAHAFPSSRMKQHHRIEDENDEEEQDIVECDSNIDVAAANVAGGATNREYSPIIDGDSKHNKKWI